MHKPAIVASVASVALISVAGACSDSGSGVGGHADALDGDTQVTDTGAAQDSLAPQDTTPVVDTFFTDTSAWLDTSVPTDTAPDIPEPDVTVDTDICSPAGGGVNIYDLQNPDCPDHPDPEPVGQPGIEVELEGVIVTGAFGDTMFVQEPSGGPYSGIAVYHNTITFGSLAPGDRVNISGHYSEFFENSQIYLDRYDKIGDGAEPEPYVPDHPAHLATDGAISELFEGVLVRVEDVKTTHTQPDCPQDFGEFEVTGGLRIDDMGIRWDARLGDAFTSITGPLNYSFGNFKVEPRTEADLAWTTKGSANAISKCIASECQAPDGALGTQQVVVTEVMPDPIRSDLGREWFELYNPTDETVDINGWEIRDCGDQRLELYGPNMNIEPGGYLVLGMDSNYNHNGGVPIDQAYGQSFYLPNTVGSLLIYDGPMPHGQLIDQVRYSRFDPWFVLKAGKSLERIDPTGDGAVPQNWATGSTSFGPEEQQGTPGQQNAATP